MGNVEMKEDGTPIIKYIGDNLPESIKRAGEYLVKKLWEDEDIKRSNCCYVAVVDTTKEKKHDYTYFLCLSFNTVYPYCTKEYPKYDDLNLCKQQVEYFKSLLDLENIQCDSLATWKFHIELKPGMASKIKQERDLSEYQKQLNEKDLKIQELLEVIKLIPGGKEHVSISKHYEALEKSENKN